MDPDGDPTLDLTPFFSDSKDGKKFVFLHIFSFNLPAGTLSSVWKILFFSLLSTFMRKGKDPKPDPDP
jgi:hypothetical protein